MYVIIVISFHINQQISKKKNKKQNKKTKQKHLNCIIFLGLLAKIGKISLFSFKIRKIHFFVAPTSSKRHCDKMLLVLFGIKRKRRGPFLSSSTKIIGPKNRRLCSENLGRGGNHGPSSVDVLQKNTCGRRGLRGHNWVHFAHRPWCSVTLNSNFAILKT